MQHLVITNFEFLLLLREKQDLSNWGIQVHDFLFDSCSERILTELCI